MTDYTGLWRQGKTGGGVSWTEGLADNAYAGQLKAKAGGSSDEYLARFDALGKSDSDVDDEAGWRTVTNLENSDPGNIESIKRQAEEWKAQGFDVRIQDLDNRDGAEWADLAVRKTDRVGEPEPDKPNIESIALSKARAFVGAKDEADMKGDTTQMKHGINPVSGETGYRTRDGKGIGSRFLSNYMDKFQNFQKPTMGGKQISREEYDAGMAAWDEWDARQKDSLNK